MIEKSFIYRGLYIMLWGISADKWLTAIVTLIAALIGLYGTLSAINKKKNDPNNKGKIVNKGDNNQSAIGDGNTFSSCSSKEKK
ncbi:hypothetical protein [Wohlfahrtiimonas chitiniclastica]|uniref:hypothetical protein n=1 Tax=Wohlfahrtiimonas chitiniclastica TaxID=400946 RepID=UPI001BCECFA3|nr:hypothetical protein [Wohlfahrtiimonas chitiniclastica]MBS7818802.1 hypothetical protein [Wohlfahrtiimonas chitiniclastica]